MGYVTCFGDLLSNTSYICALFLEKLILRGCYKLKYMFGHFGGNVDKTIMNEIENAHFHNILNLQVFR